MPTFTRRALQFTEPVQHWILDTVGTFFCICSNVCVEVEACWEQEKKRKVNAKRIKEKNRLFSPFENCVHFFNEKRHSTANTKSEIIRDKETNRNNCPTNQ